MMIKPLSHSVVSNLQLLAEISQVVGQNKPLWTQGAGGNISWKNSEFLFVKSSGFELQNVEWKQNTPTGLACVRLADWKGFWLREIQSLKKEKQPAHSETQYADLLKSSSLNSNWGRPSMETAFHALLPHPWVFHFHSLVATVLCDVLQKPPHPLHQESKALFAKLNLQRISCELPGLELARAMMSDDLQSYWAFVIDNHGVILAGNSVDVLGQWQNAESEIAKLLNLKLAPPVHKMPAKLKAYFPDSAIYWNRMKAIWDKQKPANEDSQAAELLWANLWIEENHPEMASLTTSYLEKVQNLPTELLRQSQMQKNESSQS